MKWFPPGYYVHKGSIQYNATNKEVSLLATLGEDGMLHVWDIKSLDRSTKNDVSNHIRPVIKADINKADSMQKISGTCLQLKIASKSPLVYATSDEGQIYTIDYTLKNTQDNLQNNLKQFYNIVLFRPVIAFEFSPFYSNVFLTIHDYYFCIWMEDYKKPIFVSPNLKSTFYTFGKFSPSRPSVLYLTRNNGKIDIWDFLDESHKPSVKESFIKESISSFELYQYIPVEDDVYSGESIYKKKKEYFAIGDSSGQLIMMEIPNLFTDPADNEKSLMQDLLNNEKKRKLEMDLKYRSLENEQSTPTPSIDDLDVALDEKLDINADDIKAQEVEFLAIQMSILADLGLISREELEKSKKEKEKEGAN
jgi:WD40 repeat protein